MFHIDPFAELLLLGVVFGVACYCCTRNLL